MILNRVLLILLIVFAGVLNSGHGSDMTAGLLKRIEIPVGTGPREVQWVNIVVNDWPVALKGFNVTNDGELLFNETESGMVKVFDCSGVFRFSFSDHRAVGMFLADTILFGTRRWDEHSPLEIVALSARTGRLIYEAPLASSLLSAFEMEDGKLYFRSLKEDREISIFDIKTRTLVNRGDSRQYENDSLNVISSKYDAIGYEKVGRVGQLLLYMNVDLHGGDTAGNPPCTYKLLAAKPGEKGEISKEITFEENEIGFWMPGERWPIVDGRFLYTIGYPRVGDKPGDKIWVTKVDLKGLFPDLIR